jgi:hypothetical protein
MDRLTPGKFHKDRSQEKHVPFGWNFSCLATHLIEPDLTYRAICSVAGTALIKWPLQARSGVRGNYLQYQSVPFRSLRLPSHQLKKPPAQNLMFSRDEGMQAFRANESLLRVA